MVVVVGDVVAAVVVSAVDAGVFLEHADNERTTAASRQSNRIIHSGYVAREGRSTDRLAWPGVRMRPMGEVIEPFVTHRRYIDASSPALEQSREAGVEAGHQRRRKQPAKQMGR